jgi:coproporphyrinogen III oxidase-like Fe-S oxidoreductase
MAGGAQLMEPYVAAVLREIDERAPLAAGRIVTSLYLGGGTPSLLPPAAVATLLRECRRACSFAPDAELTIEANPETVTRDRVDAWLDVGITRVSMGVQSLEDQELLSLNRPHTAARAVTAFRAIRAAGVHNISVDLLYGLPQQTVEGWRDTVRRALDLDPEHLSAYALTPETGTPIGSAVFDGRLDLPDADMVLAQEDALHDELSRGPASPAMRFPITRSRDSRVATICCIGGATIGWGSARARIPMSTGGAGGIGSTPPTICRASIGETRLPGARTSLWINSSEKRSPSAFG